MDHDSIDRIRGATFPLARRGYDKREVERFLGKLADWLEHGGDDESRSELVKRELDRVVQKTGGILTAAEEAAEELRADAARDAEELGSRVRAEADAVRAAAEKYDTETRSAADAHGERSRVEADTYSRETREGADAYASGTRKDAEVYAGETRERVEIEAAELTEEAERSAEETLMKAQDEATRIVDEANRRRADVEAVIADLEARRDSVVTDLERLASEVSGTATQHRPTQAAPEVLDGDTQPQLEEAQPQRSQAPSRRAKAQEQAPR
jgi:DivIVA domain-containing protein